MNPKEPTLTAMPAFVAPVKDGRKTSTFLITIVGLVVTSLPGLIQYAIALAERNAAQLPANSAASFALPVLIAVGYQAHRYLTTNGERQAQAVVANAQAAVAIAQVESTQSSSVFLPPMKQQEVKSKDILKDIGKNALEDLLAQMVKKEFSKGSPLSSSLSETNDNESDAGIFQTDLLNDSAVLDVDNEGKGE